MNIAATEEKATMFNALEELEKAVESLRSSTARVYDHLKLSRLAKECDQTVPAPVMPLIEERIKYIDNLKSNLNHLRTYMDEIFVAVQSI